MGGVARLQPLHSSECARLQHSGGVLRGEPAQRSSRRHRLFGCAGRHQSGLTRLWRQPRHAAGWPTAHHAGPDRVRRRSSASRGDHAGDRRAVSELPGVLVPWQVVRQRHQHRAARGAGCRCLDHVGAQEPHGAAPRRRHLLRLRGGRTRTPAAARAAAPMSGTTPTPCRSCTRSWSALCATPTSVTTWRQTAAWYSTGSCRNLTAVRWGKRAHDGPPHGPDATVD